MNLNVLPKEIRDDPKVQQAVEFIADAFYDVFVEAGHSICDGITKDGLPLEGIHGVVFKTMTANFCKAAFDAAYVKYISSGIMEE